MDEPTIRRVDAPDGSGFRGFALAPRRLVARGGGAYAPGDGRREATLVKAGQKLIWGGYSGYFADPDGFPWEVACNPRFSVE